MDPHLEQAFADPLLTVPVVFDGQNTTGIFSEEDHVVNNDELGAVQIRGTSIGIMTGSLTGLAADSPIIVDGIAYEVRRFGKVHDGKLTIVEIVEA